MAEAIMLYEHLCWKEGEWKLFSICKARLILPRLQTFKPLVELFTKMKPDYVANVEGAKSFETMPGR
jgi:hypothetical protein